MQRPLSEGTKHRLVGAGIGVVFANFMTALLVDQLQLPLHHNFITTGTLLLYTVINLLVSKYMK